jgi:HlyD family secretion protein
MTLRPALLALAALGLGALVWVAFRPEPVPVDLAEVTQGPMQGTITADGRTRIRAVYDIASPLAGTAQRALVQVGDTVAAGQTVAVVEPAAPALLDARARAEAEAALREAGAALELAQGRERQAAEELAQARTGYERTRALADRGLTSTAQLETATQAVTIRLAALAAARSQVNMAASARDRTAAVLTTPGAPSPAGCCVSLPAPVAGTVLAVPVVSEHAVAPGAVLVSVGALDDLEIVADLLSSDAVGLPAGAAAVVDRWGGPSPLAARLRRTEPRARTRLSALGIEEQRVDAVFDLLGPPEDRPGLGDGFAVVLRITAWTLPDALQVPMGALFRTGDGWAVFRADGARLRQVAVTVGRMNDTHAQVTAGLAPGDRVVSHPSEALSDGVAFRLR